MRSSEEGVVQLGNIYPTAKRHNSVAGRIYSPAALCPCLRTPTGGVTRQSLWYGGMMTETIEVGYIRKDGDGKKHQSNTVYSPRGISPCLCAGLGVKYWINILVRSQP